MAQERLSHAAETEVPRIEYDITRRLFLCGMAGAAAVFLSRPLQAQIAEPKKTIVTPDGIIRTTLQNYKSDTGDEFKLVLTNIPARGWVTTSPSPHGRAQLCPGRRSRVAIRG
jgi:hypothetical protein